MDIDQHLVWFTSAIKAAVEGDAVNRDKLIKNVGSCFIRVKKALSGVEPVQQQFEDFRIRATLLLLLCCPKVQQLPTVCASEDFTSLVATLPNLQETDFFAVVRNQKNYRYLAPLLSWLPPQVVKDIIREYFVFVDDVTPVTLAVSVELLKCLLFSCQHTAVNDVGVITCSDWLNPLTEFLSSKSISSENQATVKSSGYYYLYLCECLYLMLSVYADCTMKDPDGYPCTETWTNLWRTRGNQPSVINCCLLTEVPIKALLKLCEDNNEALSVEVWMAWSETTLPATVHIHRLSMHEHVRAQPRSIQSVIRNIAFDIVELLSGQSYLSEALATKQHSSLMAFFKQVALDPDYDPDQDLTVDQLVEKIDKLQQVKQEARRLEKLLGMLVKKEDVFPSKGALSCLQKSKAHVAASDKMQLLHRIIEMATSKSQYSTDWLDVTLELMGDIPCVKLLAVVEERLSSGLDESLKTPHFLQQLTAVFNQVAGEDAAELRSGERLVWLCLQSGRAVVEHAVTLAITLAGLVPVMAQSLGVIAPVCRANLSSGVSVLADSLLKQQECQLNEREARDFVLLVRSLLKSPGNILTAAEVLRILVEPFLTLRKGMSSKELLLPLELLKAALSQDHCAVVKLGAALPSLMMTLAQIVNSHVYLHGQSAIQTLTLRTHATQVLVTLVEAIVMEKEVYHKEISLLKHVIVKQYCLHPRTLHSLSPFLGTEFGSADGGTVDWALWTLLDMAKQGKAENMKDWLEKRGLPKELSVVSRSEWIIVLIQLLPHSTEEEWMAAVFLTHHVLQSHGSVFQTLEVFQKLLFLLCSLLVLPNYQPEREEQEEKRSNEEWRENQKGNVENKLDDKQSEEKPLDDVCNGNEEEEEEGQRDQTAAPRRASLLLVPVSLQHCFQCFASAAMVYTELMVKHLSADQKFIYMCSVFRWWCRQMPSYQCDPELPTLFLARLCATLEEMIASGRVQVKAEVGVEGLDTAKNELGNGVLGMNDVQQEALGNDFKELSQTERNITVNSSEGKIAERKNTSEVLDREMKVSLSTSSVAGPVQLTGKEDVTSINSCHELGEMGNLEIEAGIKCTNECAVSNDNGNSKPPSDATTPSVMSPVNSDNNEISLGNTGKIRGHANSREGNSTVTTEDMNLQGTCLYHQTENVHRISSHVKNMKDIKREAEQLIWCAVKHGTPSHLMASVANKLKKIYEL